MAEKFAWNESLGDLARNLVKLRQTPRYMNAVEDAGGTVADVDYMISEATAGFAANEAQSAGYAAAGAMSKETLVAFKAMRDEDLAVKAVLRLSILDLKDTNAPQADIDRLERIYRDEREISMRAFETAEKKGKRAERKNGQEPIRAETEKDCISLMQVLDENVKVQSAAAKVLVGRKVTLKRVQNLLDASRQLSGKLVDRDLKQANKQALTQAERNHVKNVRTRFKAFRGVLAIAARKEPELAAMFGLHV